MKKYIEILDKTLANIKLEMLDLKVVDYEELSSIIRWLKLGGYVLESFIDFLTICIDDSDSHENLIMMQQLKSKLVINKREIESFEKLKNDMEWQWDDGEDE